MMGDLVPFPDNVIDLDGYRAGRVAEGTWPPTDDDMEYWRGRKKMGMKQNKPAPTPPPRRHA